MINPGSASWSGLRNCHLQLSMLPLCQEWPPHHGVGTVESNVCWFLSCCTLQAEFKLNGCGWWYQITGKEPNSCPPRCPARSLSELLCTNPAPWPEVSAWGQSASHPGWVFFSPAKYCLQKVEPCPWARRRDRSTLPHGVYELKTCSGEECCAVGGSAAMCDSTQDEERKKGKVMTAQTDPSHRH